MRTVLPALLLLVGCGPDNIRSLTVESEHTGETYLLEVLSPEGSADSEALPTVYVLDGYYHFDALAKHVHRRWKRDDLAPFRLVGVGYKGLDIKDVSDLSVIDDKRTVDLSFPEHEGGNYAEGGGGDLFHAALSEELVPAIDALYETDPDQQTLMGHSLGGHFVLLDPLLFAPHSSVFTTIVSASPSIWWADGSVLAYEQERAEDPDGLPFHLIIGTGTMEGTEMNAPKEALVRNLRSRNHAGLQITELNPKAGHMDAAEAIFEDALAEVHP